MDVSGNWDPTRKVVWVAYDETGPKKLVLALTFAHAREAVPKPLKLTPLDNFCSSTIGRVCKDLEAVSLEYSTEVGLIVKYPKEAGGMWGITCPVRLC